MRVLTFLHSLEVGGVERDALRLNDELARLGVDVHVALGRTDGRLRDEAPDLRYHVFQRPGHVSTARFETLFMIARLPALIRSLRPDVLHCAGNTYAVVAVAMRLILGRKCPPIVLKVSNDCGRADLPQPVRWFYHRWLRLQAPAFAAIVAMIEPVRAEIATYLAVPPGRITVIDNGCFRADEMSRLAATRDATARTHAARHFLAVGRLARQKNFPLLVRAFARMARPDDRLTIVGEGAERARIEAEVLRTGLEHRVALPGHLNPLDDMFAVADAFVLSSDYEGLGVVVIEALAAGLPVIATSCCVAMPTLVDGVGTLVPVGDAQALATAMNAVTDDRGAVAMRRARAAAFTVEAAAPAWRTLFAEVLRQRLCRPL